MSRPISLRAAAPRRARFLRGEWRAVTIAAAAAMLAACGIKGPLKLPPPAPAPAATATPAPATTAPAAAATPKPAEQPTLVPPPADSAGGKP